MSNVATPMPSRAMAPTSVAEQGPAVVMPRFTFENVLRNVLLVGCGAMFVLPLLWLVFASFDADATRALKLPIFTMGNFIRSVREDELAALWNSVQISLVATGVATIPSILAGYAFSRHHIPFKRSALMLILFLSGVPINILIIPVYQILAQMDLLSMVPTGVFLGVTALPFELYIIKNAIDAIPQDLEEAARIEGASTTQIIWRVIIPLSMPGIVAGAIFGFVNTWGNFLAPLVLISDTDQQPSPIKIFGFMSADIIRYGDIAAYSLVYSAPVVLLYLLSSRVFKSGFVLSGAVKG
jgi:multiple sugar transport system permease protein